MSFISAIAPMLSGTTNAVTVTLARNAAGTLVATLIPKLTITEQQEADPAIAPLKAVLARPFCIDLPDSDPDAAFSAILGGVVPCRDTAQVALDEYLAAVQKAKAEAEAAAAAKAAKAAEKAKATPAKGAKAAKPAPVAEASDEGEDDGEGDEADDKSDTASCDAAPAPAPMQPAPALLADLF